MTTEDEQDMEEVVMPEHIYRRPAITELPITFKQFMYNHALTTNAYGIARYTRYLTINARNNHYGILGTLPRWIQEQLRINKC